MGNMLDYLSMPQDRIPRFSGLSDATLNRGPVSYGLVAGRTLNPSSLTHSLTNMAAGNVSITVNAWGPSLYVLRSYSTGRFVHHDS